MVDQEQVTTTVTNHLFKISEDPYEYNNLASQHPDVVAKMSSQMRQWQSLYPINGRRSQLVPPPGWRAPLDWAGYPVPMENLQAEAAPGMPPEYALKLLDMQHGERGRLVYDCESRWWSLGFCICNNDAE